MYRSACLAVAIATLWVATPASADLYRCGNAYQDRPCAGEVGKVVSSGAAPSGGSGVTPECVQRGEKAQKVAWIRETGVMEEKQLAGAKSAFDRSVIQEVYQRRGTAVEIRAAVEADCRDAKERAAQAAALRSLANQISANPQPSAPPPSQGGR